MRVLYLTVNRDRRVMSHFDEFRDELAKVTNMTVIEKSIPQSNKLPMGKLSRLLAEGEISLDNVVIQHLDSDPDYDFIFSDAFFAYMNEDWLDIPIPKGILIEDCHGKVPKLQVRKALNSQFECIFHRYHQAFFEHLSEAAFTNTFYLPHSVNVPNFDLKMEKKKQVIFLGSVHPRIYPFRQAAIDTLIHENYFLYHKRPTENPKVDRSKLFPIDSDYAKLLNSSAIAISGGSIYHYTTRKYMEIAASRTLIISDWFRDLETLGFIPGKNIICCDSKDIKLITDISINNKDDTAFVAEQGYKLIKEKHTNKQRAKDFRMQLRKLCNT